MALAALCALVLTACASDPAPTPASSSASVHAEEPGRAATSATGSLYGRVTARDGTVYEGPLRWGGNEEALWTHAFNGVKDENPWAEYAPEPSSGPDTVFRLRLPWAEDDLRRPFMARLGDVARIEALGEGLRDVMTDRAKYNPTVRVTLKSGTAVDLDRLASSDFDDGLRVWDARHGVVDLGPRDIQSVDLMAGNPSREAPDRLFGTVHTRAGQDFTGALQWNREASLQSDALVVATDAGERRLRFGAVRALRRLPDGAALVTTREGRDLSVVQAAAHRGVYVDDPRYGRVLVSWSAFDRADLARGGPGPDYDDFPPGRPLAGTVETRDGRRLTGRLVYDLDESETTETLDAPRRGIDYTLPFVLVASVDLGAGTTSPVRVTLRSGERLELDRDGDLGDQNAGLLVFAANARHPVYVPWSDVARIALDSVATDRAP